MKVRETALDLSLDIAEASFPIVSAIDVWVRDPPAVSTGVMQPLNFNLNFNLKLQVLKFRPGPGILNFKV